MRTLWYAMMMTLSCSAALVVQTPRRDGSFPVDSIVLERTGCLGSCPAYRM